MIALPIVLAALAAVAAPAAVTVDVQQPIAVIRQVGPEGRGSAEASMAWTQLARADVSQLPQILAGMDGANAVARNWIRAALDDIINRAQADQKPVPVAELETFLRDTHHDSQARRLAYELVLQKDKTAADRLLPNMLDDPSLDLRRDAVARVMDEADRLAKAGNNSVAVPTYEKALTAAREREQVDALAKKLRGLGKTVDLPAHWGFIMDWKAIGPFPNKDQKGVDTAYPPEMKIDLTAEYDGKSGKVRWKDYVTKSENGVVDLNAAVGKHLFSVAYALAEFTSAEDRDAEIRVGCYTVLKVWVNGELVMSHGDAYTGMRMDSYVAKIHLKKGKNTILFKSCQDDPPAPLPKDWKFLLRVCDETGGGLLSTTRPSSMPDRKP